MVEETAISPTVVPGANRWVFAGRRSLRPRTWGHRDSHVVPFPRLVGVGDSFCVEPASDQDVDPGGLWWGSDVAPPARSNRAVGSDSGRVGSGVGTLQAALPKYRWSSHPTEEGTIRRAEGGIARGGQESDGDFDPYVFRRSCSVTY